MIESLNQNYNAISLFYWKKFTNDHPYPSWLHLWHWQHLASLFAVSACALTWADQRKIAVIGAD